MPVEKSNVKYGCDHCNQPNSDRFIEIVQTGKFRHLEDMNLIVNVYTCPLCSLCYIQIGNEFLEGGFREEMIQPYPQNQRNF